MVDSTESVRDHAWEPPGDRACAICGIDFDDHPEPDYDIGPLSIPGKVIAHGRIVWDDQVNDPVSDAG